MNEARYLQLIAGSPGPAAAAGRAALWAVEPFYAAALAARNVGFDRGWLPSTHLPRPAVSVGNLTTGGTGKTPVVRWLAEELLAIGRRPAILSRGYKTADEPAMLRDLLNTDAGPAVPVIANPDRLAGAAAAIEADPAVDIFLLDDGFQHRRARRAFDLVLLDAKEPLGPGRAAGHVLPRGLLRERPAGLRRAGAVVLTRCDRADAAELAATERIVQRHAPGTPLFRARHAPAGYRNAAGESVGPDRSATALAACGLAHPAEFFDRVAADFAPAGTRRFADHHAFTPADVADLRAAPVDWVAVTEKDWAKLRLLPGTSQGRPAFLRAEVRVAFEANHAAELVRLILESIP